MRDFIAILLCINILYDVYTMKNLPHELFLIQCPYCYMIHRFTNFTVAFELMRLILCCVVHSISYYTASCVWPHNLHFLSRNSLCWCFDNFLPLTHYKDCLHGGTEENRLFIFPTILVAVGVSISGRHSSRHIYSELLALIACGVGRPLLRLAKIMVRC